MSASYDDLQTLSSASSALKKQSGTFSELAARYGISLDKRDRAFMPTDGSVIGFNQGIPLYADEQASFFNRISANKYHSFSDDVIGAIKFYAAAVVAIEDDVRLSKRLHIPSKRLRGFERNKVGPKDGADYVGGNYVTTLNFSTNLPGILNTMENFDFSYFIDIGNVWGVDYDSTVDQSNFIRSSTGIGLDWITPVGPLSFSLTQPISKKSTDETESFRFNLGTTF